jgi:hypothetical protein
MPHMPTSQIVMNESGFLSVDQQQQQHGIVKRGQSGTTVLPERRAWIRSTSFAFIGTIRILDEFLPDWWLIGQTHFI